MIGEKPAQGGQQLTAAAHIQGTPPTGMAAVPANASSEWLRAVVETSKQNPKLAEKILEVKELELKAQVDLKQIDAKKTEKELELKAQVDLKQIDGQVELKKLDAQMKDAEVKMALVGVKKALAEAQAKRMKMESQSDSSKIFASMLVSRDAERAQAFLDEAMELRLEEEEEFSPITGTILQNLQSLDVTSLENHETEEDEVLKRVFLWTKDGSQRLQGNCFQQPSKDVVETKTYPYIGVLLALIVGKEYCVHIVHRLATAGTLKPDIIISEEPTKPVVGVSANVVIEVKTDEQFDKPDHVLQTSGYAFRAVTGLVFQVAYALQVSVNRFRVKQITWSGERAIGEVMQFTPSNMKKLRAYFRTKCNLTRKLLPELITEGGSARQDLPVHNVTPLRMKEHASIFKVGESGVLKHLLGSPEMARALFERELEALRALHRDQAHPNVIRLIAVDGPKSWLYLSPLGQKNLAELSLFEDITEGNIARLFRGLFEGLRYVHSKGVLHRDVRPENIVY